MNKNFVVLSFGSNLGDRIGNIENAIETLIVSKIINDYRVSDIIETKALLKEDSPTSWDMDYGNAVMCGYTSLSPSSLLNKLQNIEKKIGRITSEKWAPRLIDIDILFYNDFCFSEPEITIPHPEFLKRDFFIKLCADICPNYIYPGEGEFNGKTIQLIKDEVVSERA